MFINLLKKYNNGGMIIAPNKSIVLGLLAIIFPFDSKIQKIKFRMQLELNKLTY